MGFQEPAPRPAPPRQGIAPAWWIAVPVLALGAWLWIDKRADAPPTQEPPAQTPAAEVGEPSATDGPSESRDLANLRLQLRMAEQALEEREREIKALQNTLEKARSDSDLHRRGLERAVEELNQVNQELVDLANQVQVNPQLSLPPPPVARVRPLGAPFVTTHRFGFVVASGLVHNPTDHPVRGSLEVSLVGSAGVIDTRGFPMSIGPGATERYDITFTNTFPTERLGAQARWVE